MRSAQTRRTIRRFAFLACGAPLLVGVLLGRGAAAEESGAAWSPARAASYLDGRASWWSTWPNAARDHGTFCISCHTTLPYALARPALGRMLGESAPSAAEAAVVANLTTRVRMWRDVEPFYPDQTRGIPKTSESRAIESVINALVLARRDAAAGHMSDDGRNALGYMWALQMKTGPNSGAWTWLNFGYEPWESPNSPYLGASLAALAVGAAPESYRDRPEIQDNLTHLREYFQRRFDEESMLNRLMALWASGSVPGLLRDEQRQIVIDAAFAGQQGDGGWAAGSLGAYKRVDGTPLETSSDGYATGLVTLALQQARVPSSEPHLARGLAWLRTHQDPTTGRWPAASLNKQRDPESDLGKFMSDAATAYAVMALDAAR